MWAVGRLLQDLAPVPLSIFRSNSKFDENSECSSFKYIRPITTIFCTRHDSVTVVTCAKHRCDRPRIFYTRVFWIGPGSPEKMGRVLQRAGFTWAGFSRGPSSPDTRKMHLTMLTGIFSQLHERVSRGLPRPVDPELLLSLSYLYLYLLKFLFVPFLVIRHNLELKMQSVKTG